MQQKRLNWCEKHCIGFVPTCFHFAGSIAVAIQRENTITRMCEIEHERYTTEKEKKREERKILTLNKQMDCVSTVNLVRYFWFVVWFQMCVIQSIANIESYCLNAAAAGLWICLQFDKMRQLQAKNRKIERTKDRKKKRKIDFCVIILLFSHGSQPALPWFFPFSTCWDEYSSLIHAPLLGEAVV